MARSPDGSGATGQTLHLARPACSFFGIHSSLVRAGQVNWVVELNREARWIVSGLVSRGCVCCGPDRAGAEGVESPWHGSDLPSTVVVDIQSTGSRRMRISLLLANCTGVRIEWSASGGGAASGGERWTDNRREKMGFD